MALNTLGPDAEKQGGESFRWAGKLHCVKSRVWKYIKNALLSVVIVIVVLLLFLPTILYHLPILSVYLKTKYFLGQFGINLYRKNNWAYFNRLSQLHQCDQQMLY